MPSVPNMQVPRDVNDAVDLIKRAGKNMILTVARSEDQEGSQFSRSRWVDKKEGE